jgi:2-iminoacetate synthase
MSMSGAPFQVDEDSIQRVLAEPALPDAEVRTILAKAALMKGLSYHEVGALIRVTDPVLLDEMFHTARKVKEEIYGNRIVLFAPLYASNVCGNECVYCAFRASNKTLERKTLTPAELQEETRAMIRQGHKRIVLLAGEALGVDYILEAIKAIYATKEGNGEIRRINVEIAPMSVEDFRRLHASSIGTYITFQETYHRATYEQNHLRGRKKDFSWRLECMDRAMEAGIEDVGIGALLGLTDWRFEVLAMIQHANHLERRFGCGPHTISVPRIEPADGSEVSLAPPHAVNDLDFRKLIAILRMAVPYTGIILSTRERADTRQACLQLGVSQISAGSRTDPGGYGQEHGNGAQFSLGDHRSLDEVVRDLAEMDFVPSFCTGCYRLGRVGADFMDLAKPGEIKSHCHPNAVSTFQEYLQDYASPATVAAGEACIERTLKTMEPGLAEFTRTMAERVRKGERDVYC